MTKLINCSPEESLGYVSYYRAVYDRERSVATLFMEIPDSVFQGYLNDVVAKLNRQSPQPVVNVNTPKVASNNAAVLDVRTYPAGQDLTVADLVKLLDPTLILPSEMFGVPVAGVALASLERIDKSQATLQDRANAEHEREAQQEDESLSKKIGDALGQLRIVIIVVAIAVALYFAFQLAQKVKA